MQSSRRVQASKVLAAAAKKMHSPHLSQLASSVRKGGVFKKVKQAINDMIAKLEQENEDEIKHKDFCVEEFNKNLLETSRKEHQKNDLTAKLDNLDTTLKTLTDAINTLTSNISEMQLQMKRAGEDREKQNIEFQQTVADQK